MSGEQSIALLVVGAHMSGGPLNAELIARSATLRGPARTAPSYRLYRLATDPPKPGLVRVGADDDGGAAIDGELWELPGPELASLLAELPPPMALGPVRLEDRTQVVGFLCEPLALVQAEDITGYRGWRRYLQSLELSTGLGEVTGDAPAGLRQRPASPRASANPPARPERRPPLGTPRR